MSNVSITAHVDTTTPVDVVAGAKHLGWDVTWGWLKQKLHLGTGDIDKRCLM